MIIAIIPARGGSEGIPGKNIKVLHGKPLIAYTIESALNTDEIDHVYVSTDNADIAAVSRQYGAQVIDRPADISGAKASSEAALLHALNKVDGNVELVVFLQATSPMRRNDDISRAIQQLRQENADSLFSANEVHGFVWRLQPEGAQSFTFDYRNRQMRQDAPTDVIENGSIYVFKPHILHQHNNRLGGKIAVYIMDSIYSFQIDTLPDFTLIEALMTILQQEKKQD